MLGDDESATLMSYLESRPVLNRDSNQFSQALLTSLDKTGSFPEYAKATDVAKSIANRLNGNPVDKVHTKFIDGILKAKTTDKIVPLTYNFSDPSDITRLKSDPLMSNYSTTDQEDLLNYLQSNPVTVKSSNSFSNSLTSGLQNLPKSIKPVSFASSLASKINRNRLNISRPTANHNLLNKTGLSSFYKTNTFRNSGVNKAQFTSVVNSSRQNIDSYTPDNSVMFPLTFKTTTPKLSTPIETEDNSPNNIYNQGYVVKRRNNNTNSQPVVKQINNTKIKDVYAGFSKPDRPTPQPSVIPKLQAVQSMPVTPSSSQTTFNKPVTKQPKVTNIPPRTPEQQKMDRIQENYINDKEALANQGKSMPTGQQMLAKSKNSSSSGKGGTGAGNSRKVIEEGAELLSDSVLTEYKNRNY